jgi:hypothetical protein
MEGRETNKEGGRRGEEMQNLNPREDWQIIKGAGRMGCGWGLGRGVAEFEPIGKIPDQL